MSKNQNEPQKEGNQYKIIQEQVLEPNKPFLKMYY